MGEGLDSLNERRLRIQSALDAAKTQAERNKLGQYATPSELALEIIRQSVSYLGSGETIRFLDPAFGTGSFYGALLQTLPQGRIESARGYEIDPHYGVPATELWSSTSLELHLEDFTRAKAPLSPIDRANLLICNPPYVRHHHLEKEEKERLQQLVRHVTGKQLSGLTGLYCYFLLMADLWLAENGVACWLIPSEFMDVKYGKQIKEYLSDEVTLLRIHRFDPERVQFRDALVSSVIIWFRKQRPVLSNTVEFSYGDDVKRPYSVEQIRQNELNPADKWTPLFSNRRLLESNHERTFEGIRLRNLFDIKRGIATGANDFFILTERQIELLALPPSFLKPILPSPRYLGTDEINADIAGNPVLKEPIYLLDCPEPESIVQEQYPLLWQYLQSGVSQNIHLRYLCRHRSPWYAQEQRLPAPLLCTYMGRQSNGSDSRPFRFIRNRSRATAANVYLLLYPKAQLRQLLRVQPGLLDEIWQRLNAIAVDKLIDNGRTYGGKLHKLEPKELGNIIIEQILPDALMPLQYEQARLLEGKLPYSVFSSE